MTVPHLIPRIGGWPASASPAVPDQSIRQNAAYSLRNGRVPRDRILAGGAGNRQAGLIPSLRLGTRELLTAS